MTDRSFASLRAAFDALAPLPDKEWQAFAGCVQPIKLSAGDLFVRPGDAPDKIGFILKGLFKASYITRMGSQFVSVFAAENGFAGALSDMLAGRAKSQVEIVAVEPTELLSFTYQDFYGRFDSHAAWQKIGRLLAERYFIGCERRRYELLSMPAKERFASFLSQYPGLAARISQKDLAAYIGITPPALSRLRASFSP